MNKNKTQGFIWPGKESVTRYYLMKFQPCLNFILNANKNKSQFQYELLEKKTKSEIEICFFYFGICTQDFGVMVF